jgi:hypothetical protein
MARGLKIREPAARYVCRVTHLTAVPHDPPWTQTIVVMADSELDAAREAAAIVARQFYPNGQAGSVTRIGKRP